MSAASTTDRFPSAPFSFVGIPEKVSEGTFRTFPRDVQSMVVTIVQVTKGTYDKREIGFDFPVGAKPPLEIGRRYLFTAVYDRHGIRYTDWKKEKAGGKGRKLAAR